MERAEKVLQCLVGERGLGFFFNSSWVCGWGFVMVPGGGLGVLYFKVGFSLFFLRVKSLTGRFGEGLVESPLGVPGAGNIPGSKLSLELGIFPV